MHATSPQTKERSAVQQNVGLQAFEEFFEAQAKRPSNLK